MGKDNQDSFPCDDCCMADRVRTFDSSGVSCECLRVQLDWLFACLFDVTKLIFFLGSGDPKMTFSRGFSLCPIIKFSTNSGRKHLLCISVRTIDDDVLRKLLCIVLL